MLHALSLEFNHPFTKAQILIEAPLPEDMIAFKEMLLG
jgi:23S rRNA-/tRNA-specific pseudouridylate synthase